MAKFKSIKLLTNKYIIVGGLFLIWMTFFDTNSVYNHLKLSRDLSMLEKEKQYITTHIKKEEEEYKKLNSSKEALEKFAREKYYFKKKNEDIFVIEESKKETK